MTSQRAGRALLIGERVRLKEMARVARTALTEVHISSSLEEAPSDEWDLVVVDYEVLSPPTRAVVFERFARQCSDGRLLLCMGESQRTDLAPLLQGHTLTHLLAGSGQVDPAEFLITVQKILGREIFGIEKYFPWGSEVQRFTLQRASDRFATIRAAAEFAEKNGTQGRFVELFQTATDELTTNALYNAPVDDEGVRSSSHLSRTEEVELPADKPVQVTLCADGSKLGIAVADAYGSLKPDTVVSYLSKCFRRGPDQVDEKQGGAGLGLYYLFESLSQFVINVAPGERTEMMGILDIRGRYKDFSERPKSFNVFLSP